MKCDVCRGMGTYPIYGGHGGYLYDIQCPECAGLGNMEEKDLPTHEDVRGILKDGGKNVE